MRTSARVFALLLILAPPFSALALEVAREPKIRESAHLELREYLTWKALAAPPALFPEGRMAALRNEVLAKGGTIVPLLVVNDKANASAWGSEEEARAQIALRVALVNQVFAMSKVNAYVEETVVADPGVVTPENEGKLEKVFSALVTHPAVKKLRKVHKAALVTIAVRRGDYGGLANVATDDSDFTEPALGYSVFRLGSLTALPHEIGHNAGGLHDRAHLVLDGAPAKTPNKTVWGYAYGYVTPKGNCDIMGICERRHLAFSNPRIRVEGERMGVAKKADMSRLLNRNLPRLVQGQLGAL